MDEKRTPIIHEEPKYKKKAPSKGLPRSKHKHIYKTVLLTTEYETHDIKTGLPTKFCRSLPTKVCTICGRIDKIDLDDSYYLNEKVSTPYIIFNYKLSEKALRLPKWYAEGYFAKFAIKEKE